jgi:hypothetical protein
MGVKVSVGMGEGVRVSITICGAGNVAVGTIGAGWQATRKNKRNRL